MYCYGNNFPTTTKNVDAFNYGCCALKKNLILIVVFFPFILIFHPQAFINLELAIWPGLLLMLYIATKSKLKRDSKDLIVELMLSTGYMTISLCMIAAILGDLILVQVLDSQSWLFLVVRSFIRIALLEETIKYRVLTGSTWTNKEFDHKFAAVVFAVAVGMGFAITENIEYAIEYGIDATIRRFYTAVPMHCALAVFMGWFYGKAKEFELLENLRMVKKYKLLALIVPVIVHGIYDFLIFAKCYSEYEAFTVAIFLFCYYKIDCLAKRDALFQIKNCEGGEFG